MDKYKYHLFSSFGITFVSNSLIGPIAVGNPIKGEVVIAALYLTKLCRLWSTGELRLHYHNHITLLSKSTKSWCPLKDRASPRCAVLCWKTPPCCHIRWGSLWSWWLIDVCIVYCRSEWEFDPCWTILLRSFCWVHIWHNLWFNIFLWLNVSILSYFHSFDSFDKSATTVKRCYPLT